MYPKQREFVSEHSSRSKHKTSIVEKQTDQALPGRSFFIVKTARRRVSLLTDTLFSPSTQFRSGRSTLAAGCCRTHLLTRLHKSLPTQGSYLLPAAEHEFSSEYEKAPENRSGFPGAVSLLRNSIATNQRLLNWGARRAPLRPYFFLSFILGSLVRKPAFLRTERRVSSY